MNTKLTLSIEQDLIGRAKKYAKDRGRSLSDLVENYFKMLTHSEESETIEISPRVKSLMGSFTLPDDMNYKEVIEDEIIKKHA